MYRILRFTKTARKGWQDRGETLATFHTFTGASAELERRRAGDTATVFYRIACDPTAAMIEYRTALTECERALSRVQHGEHYEARTDAEYATLADVLLAAATRLSLAGRARLAEVDGKV